MNVILQCNYHNTTSRGLHAGLLNRVQKLLSKGLSAVELSSNYGINRLILRIV